MGRGRGWGAFAFPPFVEANRKGGNGIESQEWFTCTVLTRRWFTNKQYPVDKSRYPAFCWVLLALLRWAVAATCWAGALGGGEPGQGLAAEAPVSLATPWLERFFSPPDSWKL